MYEFSAYVAFNKATNGQTDNLYKTRIGVAEIYVKQPLAPLHKNKNSKTDKNNNKTKHTNIPSKPTTANNN